MPKSSHNYIYGTNSKNAFINNTTSYMAYDTQFTQVKNDINTVFKEIILMNEDRAKLFEALKHGRGILEKVEEDLR